MRISDWSSDWCSSDLHAAGAAGRRGAAVCRVLPAAGRHGRPVRGDAAALVLSRHVFRAAGVDRPGLVCAAHLGAGFAGGGCLDAVRTLATRSEEHTSELQSLMRISYAVFCLKKKNTILNITYFISLIVLKETTYTTL